MNLTPWQAQELSRAATFADRKRIVAWAVNGVPGGMIIGEIPEASLLDICMMLAGLRNAIESMIDGYARAHPDVDVRRIIEAAAKEIAAEVRTNIYVTGRRDRGEKGGAG